MARRRESPTRRKNPSGKIAWAARWTDKTGKRRYGMPPEIPGTYSKKGPCREGGTTCCAQHAIEACYELDERGPAKVDTIGGYFATWTATHPRSAVTNYTNECRIRVVLDVELDGVRLRDWRIDSLRRRHAYLLLDHILTVMGRAPVGAKHILSALSVMAEDAITDEVAVLNPFRGVKLRPNDPRIQKRSRPVRVFTWEQMHEFAAACGRGEGGSQRLREWRPVYAEAMVRTLGDCGLRAGELLALGRRDLDLRAGTLRVERSVALGEVLDGTKTTHHEVGELAGRTVPVPDGLMVLLRGLPARIDTPLLFPNPRGVVWRYQMWWAQVWEPGRRVSGLDIRPHEMRHSHISLLRAAGIDPADLALVSGHSVQTATARYTHGLGKSFDAIREAMG